MDIQTETLLSVAAGWLAANVIWNVGKIAVAAYRAKKAKAKNPDLLSKAIREMTTRVTVKEQDNG